MIYTNEQVVDKKRYEKIERLCQIKSRGYKLVFIDETSMITNVRSEYGYSHVNEQIYSKFPNFLKNYSTVAAISEENLIGVMVFEGSVNSNDFGAFLVTLIQNNE